MSISSSTPGKPQRLSSSTFKALEATLVAGAGHYRRATMLPRLLPRLLVSDEDEAVQTSALIIAALREALRLERVRAGHWAYDLNRHMGLAQALRAELDLQKNALVQARTNARNP